MHAFENEQRKHETKDPEPPLVLGHLLEDDTVKQKIEKWQREIARIQNAVVRLLDYRRWNQVYEQIVAANPLLHPGIPVLDYFRNIYGDYAVMAIRRQCRPQKDSVSLLWLLYDLKENVSFITRAWTRDLYHQPTPGGTVYLEYFANILADSSFKQFSDKSGDALDPAIVQADIERLETATKEILSHSDRVVAHDDRRGPEFEVNFDQLNGAIDAIEEITKRYILLFTGASMLSMTPIDQTNAVSVFSFPWVDPGHRPDFGSATD